MMEEITGFVGRKRELAKVVESLRQGHSLLVKGRPGIGKRALLRRVREELAGERKCLWPDMTSARTMAHTLAEQTHLAAGLLIPERLIPPRWRAQVHREGRVAWERIRRNLLRQPVAEILALVVESVRGRDDVVVFIESLEVPPTQVNALHDLAEVCQLAACIEDSNRRARVTRLLWRFQMQIELEPLRSPESRELVARWLEHHPVTFDTARVRQAFIRAVVQDAGGVPAAIEGMLQAATNDGHVSRSRVREYRHEAAAVYWDMTPLLLVVAAGFMAMRYISRGAGLQELMVLAGVGTSLFWLVLFFARRFSSGGAR